MRKARRKALKVRTARANRADVPTSQIFDAIWQTTLPWLRKQSSKAADHLEKTNFTNSTMEHLSKHIG